MKDSGRVLIFGKTWRFPVRYGDPIGTLQNKFGGRFRAFHTANPECGKQANYSVLFIIPYVVGRPTITGQAELPLLFNIFMGLSSPRV
jgi:hypothetical protein